MNTVRSLRVLLIAAVLLLGTASSARAQSKGVEVGTSLMSLMVSFEDGSNSILGVPSAGLGLFNPGVFASVFVNDRISVEPQLGLIAFFGDGDSGHILNFGGQGNYFLKGIAENSVYVFGAAGIVHVSESDGTIKSVSGGAGYRMLMGDRLTMRFDGRIIHFTQGGGNALAITVSLGGIFGRK